MATLNGGITSTAELIRVSGSLPPAGSYVTIDSEALRVNGAARGAQGRNFTRDYLAVDRGVAGTTKATHSNGATLTRYYPEAEATGGGGGVTVTGSQGGSVSGATEFRAAGLVADLGSGVAGQGLVFQLLGPFTIAHDTPGLVVSGDNPGLGAFAGVLLAAVPSGAIMRDVFVTVTVGWSNAEVLSFQASDGTDNAFMSWSSTATPSNTSPKTTNLDQANAVRVIFPADDGLYAAAVYTEENGPPAAGEATVYAIIATPAS